MILLIFPLCILFGIDNETIKCVSTTEHAKIELRSSEYKHVLYAPHPFENGKPFMDYVKKKYPDIKIEGLLTWCGDYL